LVHRCHQGILFVIIRNVAISIAPFRVEHVNFLANDTPTAAFIFTVYIRGGLVICIFLLRRGLVDELVIDTIVKVAVVIHFVLTIEVFDPVSILDHFFVNYQGKVEALMRFLHALVRPGTIEWGEDETLGRAISESGLPTWDF
jgi:hypothetical protein